MITTARRSAFQSIGSADDWIEHSGNAYRFPVYITAIESGFVATSLTVPIVEASGKMEADALCNVTAALANAVKEAKAGHAEHPKSGDAPRGAKWVFIRL